MTDSIRGTGTCPAAATIDDYLREATGARSEASASHHAEGHDPTEQALQTGLDVTSAVADVVGGAASGGVAVGLELGGMVTAIASAWATWALAPIEGERRNIEYDSEMMRGCLAAFEGRADDPEVRAFMAESPAFATGVRDAERIATRDPELFACIRAAVVSANDAGANAVYDGSDETPEVAARAVSDLAFRHGLEEARNLRDRDPIGYDAARSEARSLHTAMSDARMSVTARA